MGSVRGQEGEDIGGGFPRDDERSGLARGGIPYALQGLLEAYPGAPFQVPLGT